MYILQSCLCKVDNIWGFSLVGLSIRLLSCSDNITTIDGDDVVVVTEGEDTIEYYEISFDVLMLLYYLFCITYSRTEQDTFTTDSVK